LAVWYMNNKTTLQEPKDILFAEITEPAATSNAQ
jgi:hypothetical protein